jgi:hypothetical protein
MVEWPNFQNEFAVRPVGQNFLNFILLLRVVSWAKQIKDKISVQAIKMITIK